jgi:beta-lactamase superfamily II metal-dependent hydrolase
MTNRLLAVTVLALALASLALGQANGKLQIHFMDVGQGDGAVLISPQGQVVLFDAGKDLKRRDCVKPLSYLDQLGITRLDYVVVSHYHYDHIGCVPDVLQQSPVQRDVLDRGHSYPGATYQSYLAAVGGHRLTAAAGDTVQLDAGSPNPVLIRVVAVNGAGVTTTNENDLSLAVTVAFGAFRAEIGGDLSGDNTASYKDIETGVAPQVGPIDVYKVHHHCSSHSTNDAWVATTKPAVGIISTGVGNDYGHPTPDCLERLHVGGVKTYWTETGNGVAPEAGLDVVGGNIVVEVAPGASTYSVKPSLAPEDTYPIAAAGPPPGPAPKFAWSRNSSLYHFATCSFVNNISPQNLQKGDTPPEGKTLHQHCPLGGH